jgi:hypothetical protein
VESKLAEQSLLLPNVSQVRFALCSSPIFSRTDTITDSERFYNTIIDLFDDIDENEEVNDLETWWNRSVSNLSLLAQAQLTI